MADDERGRAPIRKGPRQNGETCTLLHAFCCEREEGQLSSRALADTPERMATPPDRTEPAGSEQRGHDDHGATVRRRYSLGQRYLPGRSGRTSEKWSTVCPLS